MDTFTYMVAVLLMMLAIQFNQNWLVFAIVALMILTMRSLGTTVLLLVSTAVLFLAREYLKEYWPFVLFGLIILSLIIGRGGGSQPEAMPMDLYGGGLDAGGFGGLPGGL
ncbi:MAG: hypothetical protein JW744_01820 [Candidatus Diapherotrites archaeon]|uniref:Uncharacterized protein n=1 Tax=Candidatus Iainarchaeum sp. TaxID=3101447 RepID=A0A938YXK6_9ARCH|nr:hypothetical protein [Candidatus Diapherotrites archaeon]